MNNENSFALNFAAIWKILNEAKVFAGHFSIASVNRLFFEGSKNKYMINEDNSIISKEIEVIKQLKGQVEIKYIH